MIKWIIILHYFSDVINVSKNYIKSNQYKKNPQFEKRQTKNHKIFIIRS